MSDSRFNTELDALVTGDPTSSTSELTEFAANLYGEEQQVVMPNALKQTLAAELGLSLEAAQPIPTTPISNRTARALKSESRSNQPWFIAFAVAAGLVLALTGILLFGLPGGDDNDNQFLLSSPAVPTVSATPPATAPGSEAWFAPVSAEECPQEELIDRGSWVFLQRSRAESYTPVPVEDQPYSMPNRADAESVVTRQRQGMACINSQTDLAFPIESPRRAWLNSAESADMREEINADALQRSMALSAYAEDDLGLSVEVLTYDSEEVAGYVWNPADAVQMADGRVALIPGYASEPGETLPALQGTAPVWALVDGEWLLDEELLFCIGDCDSFWQQVGYATPEASPEMADEYDASWMLPVDPASCTSNGSASETAMTFVELDAIPRREYTIVGPANPADAAAANEVARQAQACDDPRAFMSEQLLAETEYSGEGFSPLTLVQLNRQWEDGQIVSAALMENGAQPTDFTIVAGNDNPMFADIEDGTYQISNPYLALQLEDGRIVIPWVEVTVASDEPSGSRIENPYIGTSLVMIDNEGTWEVDGQLPICIGDCDLVWSQLHGLYLDAVYLMPISTEECTLNDNLPQELADTEIAVSHSRQYRACEQSGDASAMQGPEYKLTESTDSQPVSEEIATLYRQSGEGAGDLQQVWDVSLIPVLELPDDTWTTFQPGSVVTLADGRVAVIETTVQSSEVSGTGRTNPVITKALIWIVEGDEWLLDEEATICLGSCDSYWNTAGTPEAETSGSSAEALVLPETCGEEFQVDFTSHAIMPITMRPGAGMASGTSVAQLPAGTELQYLCEFEETSSPSGDRMEEGQRWLKVRTADGTEGWVREIDVEPVG